MDRTAIMEKIKQYRDTVDTVSGKLNNIDPRFRDDEQKRLRSEIWASEKGGLDDAANEIRGARKELQKRRQAESDPFRSLFKAGYQRAGEVNLGMAMLAESLDIFETGKLVDLAIEFQNPALLLKAWTVIKSRENDDTRKDAETRLYKEAHRFIDTGEVREAASLERELAQAELYAIESLGVETAEKKLSLGRTVAALDKILVDDPGA